MNPAAPRRNTTGLSGIQPSSQMPQPRRTLSLMQQAQLQSSPPPEPEMKQETYSTYELDWAKLKAFLELRFAPLTFEERRSVNKDRYLFLIPASESLTDADRVAIAKLMNPNPASNEPRQRSQSPPEW